MVSEPLRLFKQKIMDQAGHTRWSAQDEDGHRIYAFEVHAANGGEREAWTFVIERDGALEIEELYHLGNYVPHTIKAAAFVGYGG